MAATSLAADQTSFQVGKRCRTMQSAGFLGMCQRIGFSSATLLAFIVLGGSITGASAQDRVRLTFAWPETVRATVTTSFDTASVAGGNRSRLTGTSRARISASPTENGLLISYETGATQFESRSGDGIWVRIHEFLFEVGLQHPDFQVGRDGRFRNVGDPITHINAVATDLAGEIAAMPGRMKSHVRPALEHLLSERELTAHAGINWELEVGSWSGLQLETGAPIQTTETFDFPTIGRQAASVTRTLIGRAACAAPNGCVELEVRIVVDTPEAKAAFDRHLQENESRLRADVFRQELSARVITDPDTLLPYRIHESQMTIMDVLYNGRSRNLREAQDLQIVYRYD